MSKPIRICFLADRHNLFDDRIYWKMAVPLVKRGYTVHYLLIGGEAASGTTDEGVHFKILKLKTFAPNRFLNFFLKRFNPRNNYRIMFEEAKRLEADIYHFHDLWINRIAVKLKNLRHHPVVFYDAREPYAEDYMSYVKTHFPLLLRIFASWINSWEKKQSKNYDLIIANENIVQQNFANVVGEERAVVLYNYTDLAADHQEVPLMEKKYDLIYTGAITALRGAFEIVKAVKKVREEIPEVKALFLGNCYPPEFKERLRSFIDSHNLAHHIELAEAVPYPQVAHYYQLSKIGLVLLQRIKTFEISMPIKLFEYMAHGLPVIGSDFGHMKSYIQNDDCGIAVDPTDTEAIAKAVVDLLTNHELYERYSDNGKRVSRERYRWELEFEKLMSYYNKALDAR
ncbi:glycosyltransferase [Lutimonas vermicola]|uniref:Glycosyltransferase n=1 Tax=Lutimonas vermicola TaxID=414288 RepID=A0ABU9KZJ4_9FLAO